MQTSGAAADGHSAWAPLRERAFALVWVEEGEQALNVNEAQAYASCSDCVSVAVAFQVVLVLPAGAVERGPAEGAGQVGDDRSRQLADRRDHDVGLHDLATGQLDPPPVRVLVERRGDDLRAEPDAVDHLGRDPPQVGVDVGALGVPARPVRVRRERVGVQRRRDVAGRAGVRVVPPHAPEVVRAFQHGHVDTVAPQGDGHADAREARADDDDTRT